MGMISLMTATPLAYLDIKMTYKYANSVDERGKKIGVPKSPIGIGKLEIFSPTLLNALFPDGILWVCLASLWKAALIPQGFIARRAHHLTTDSTPRPGMRPMPGLLISSP
jgi:hypothetical protein